MMDELSEFDEMIKAIIALVREGKNDNQIIRGLLQMGISIEKVRESLKWLNPNWDITQKYFGLPEATACEAGECWAGDCPEFLC